MEWAGNAGLVLSGRGGQQSSLNSRSDRFRRHAREEDKAGTSQRAPATRGFDVHRLRRGGTHVWLRGGGAVSPTIRGVLRAHPDGERWCLHALTARSPARWRRARTQSARIPPPSDIAMEEPPLDRFPRLPRAQRVRARAGVNRDRSTRRSWRRPPRSARIARTNARGEICAASAGDRQSPLSRVSIKATTTEKLGFTGRPRGFIPSAAHRPRPRSGLPEHRGAWILFPTRCAAPARRTCSTPTQAPGGPPPSSRRRVLHRRFDSPRSSPTLPPARRRQWERGFVTYSNESDRSSASACPPETIRRTWRGERGDGAGHGGRAPSGRPRGGGHRVSV